MAHLLCNKFDELTSGIIPCCWLCSWCMCLYLHTSMLLVDEKFFGFLKKPKYRYRSLKEHEDMDNALFKINYDLKSPSEKSQLV